VTGVPDIHAGDTDLQFSALRFLPASLWEPALGRSMKSIYESGTLRSDGVS
jgi:hypothetical protein